MHGEVDGAQDESAGERVIHAARVSGARVEDVFAGAACPVVAPGEVGAGDPVERAESVVSHSHVLPVEVGIAGSRNHTVSGDV